MRHAVKTISLFSTVIPGICLLLFSTGCGTSSSYSVHTIPQDVTGTWQGTASLNNAVHDLTLSFVQTGDVMVVAYAIDDETGTVTGSYQSGSLSAGNSSLKFNLLFLMNTATGTLTIGEDELTVSITKQQN